MFKIINLLPNFLQTHVHVSVTFINPVQDLLLLTGRPSYLFSVSRGEPGVTQKPQIVLLCFFFYIFVYLCSFIIYLLPVPGILKPPGRHKLWRPLVPAISPQNMAPSDRIYRGSEQNDKIHIHVLIRNIFVCSGL